MTTFRLISPAAALELLAGIGVADKEAALAALVEGDQVRAYAKMTIIIDGRGEQSERRDQRIHRDVWSRILEQGKIEDVWSTGSVRLESDGILGGRSAMKLIGIRFNEAMVRDAAVDHAACPTVVGAERFRPTNVVVEPLIVPAADAPPLIEMVNVSEPTAQLRKGLADDAVVVSVADAREILGLSNTTVYKLIGQGDLRVKKSGKRTLVFADSIREYLARP